MKKLILALIASVALFTSCKPVPPVDNLLYLVGEWTLVGVNNTTLPTDSIKVLSLNPDFSANYAHSVRQADQRMVWLELRGLSFALNGDIITIQSMPNTPNPVVVKMQIAYLSDFSMSCRLTKYTVNGVEKANGELLYFEKSIYNLKNEITGIWQSNLPTQNEQWFWDYKTGGKYDFYIYDPVTKQYKTSSVDKSYYRIYGRYLVNIYSDSLVDGPTADKVDVWKIYDFTEISMMLISLDAQGVPTIYRLARVGELP